MEKIYIDTAKILKAISDPKRLKIVDMLSCREQCACKLQKAFAIKEFHTIMGEIFKNKLHCVCDGHDSHERKAAGQP